uniref:Uncharacterized protein n=1 Tax=uncultured Acetothermia bacterium TaxID=236499 RepID=H5SH27_9BACT|nr:hypothetical protein HGMM_F27H04C21 [uncultured Acetothermia bacterium]
MAMAIVSRNAVILLLFRLVRNHKTKITITEIRPPRENERIVATRNASKEDIKKVFSRKDLSVWNSTNDNASGIVK